MQTCGPIAKLRQLLLRTPWSIEAKSVGFGGGYRLVKQLGGRIGLRFGLAIQLALALLFLLFLLFQFLLALLVLIVWFCQWGTVFGKVGLETPL